MQFHSLDQSEAYLGLVVNSRSIFETQQGGERVFKNQKQDVDDDDHSYFFVKS